MPIVEALCLHDAYDSTACFYYEKGRTYPIDTDSEVARLMTRPQSSGKVNEKGEIVAAKLSRPSLPVFQFDRALPLGAVSNGKPSDYTCDECGKKCKSLNELGSHTRSKHPKQPLVDETEEEAVVRQVCICKTCNPPRSFNSRYELMKHRGEAHGANFFKKGFGKQEGAVSVAA
jgi:hypothetical protein